MKKFIYLMFITISILYVSCSEEKCYSCEDNVDKWAHDNLENLQKLKKRSEILKYNGAKQRAIYRAIDPDSKKSIWMDKIQNLKSIARTTHERNFFIKIEKIIIETDFNREWREDEMLKYENILTTASEEFGWSKKFMVYAFGTLNTIHSIENPISEKTKEKDFFDKNFGNKAELTQEGDTVDCNCNWGYCPGSSCEDSSCEETTTGCSFLLLGPCDEICA